MDFKDPRNLYQVIYEAILLSSTSHTKIEKDGTIVEVPSTNEFIAQEVKNAVEEHQNET